MVSGALIGHGVTARALHMPTCQAAPAKLQPSSSYTICATRPARNAKEASLDAAHTPLRTSSLHTNTADQLAHT